MEIQKANWIMKVHHKKLFLSNNKIIRYFLYNIEIHSNI